MKSEPMRHLSVIEASRALRHTPSSVRTMFRDGRLRGRREGVAILIDPEAITEPLRDALKGRTWNGSGKMDRPVWHYTALPYVRPILTTGELLPSLGMGSAVPLLWFTSAQQWEPAMNRDLSAKAIDREEASALSLGCARFGMDRNTSALMTWTAACRFASIPPTKQTAMERAAVAIGSDPRGWYAMPGPVPVDGLTLEVWNGTAWVRPEALA